MIENAFLVNNIIIIELESVSDINVFCVIFSMTGVFMNATRNVVAKTNVSGRGVSYV